MAITPDITPAIGSLESRDDALRRLSLLAATGSLLGVSLDHAELLERVADLLVPAFADLCMIDLIAPDGAIERLTVRHAAHEQDELIRTLAAHAPKPIGTHPMLEVVSQGRPVLFGEMSDEILRRIASDEEHLRAIRALGVRSAMIVPLLARGKTLGTLSLVTTVSARAYGVEDLEIVEDVAHRVALAIDNARLFAEVQSAKERYGALVHSLDAIVYEWDIAAQCFTFASDRVESLLGYPRSEWLRDARMLERILHPQDRQWVLERYAEQVSSGADASVEYRVVARDGRTLWIRDSISIERDDAGRPRVLRGMILDVTRRKLEQRYERAREAVVRVFAETESLTEIPRALLQATCEMLDWEVGALWRVDAASGTLRCVDIWSAPAVEIPQFEALTMRMAFPPGVGLPGRVWDTGQPAWVERLETDRNFTRAPAAAAEGLNAGMAFPVVAGGRTLGVIEFFHRSARPLDEDLLALMTSIGAQVGQFVERRQAEEALHEAEARARAVLESSLDAVLSMDSRGGIVEFNPAAEQMFGVARDDVVGRPLVEVIVPPSLRDAHRKGLARYLATRDARILNRRVELTAMRGDGSEFPVEVTIVRVEASGPPMFTGFIRDISQRVRAERRRRAQFATTRVLADATTLEDAAPKILEALCEALDWQLGVMWSANDDALEPLAVHATHAIASDPVVELTTGAKLRRGEGVPGTVWISGEAFAGPTDARTPRAEAAHAAGLEGWLGFPVRHGARVLGVLEFFTTRASAPDDELHQMLSAIGSQIGQYVIRRRAENDIRFQKAILESQNEATIDGIILTSANGDIESFNRRFVEMWHLPDDVAHGDRQTLGDYVLAQHADPDAFMQRAVYLHTHPELADREEINLLDGRTFDRFTAPLRSEDGEYYGRAWYYRDITESKQTQAALAASSHRFAFLAEASTILVGSLDQWLTLSNLARLVVPYLADWCVIDVLQDDGTVRRIAVNHSDPERRALAENREVYYDLDPNADRGVPKVLRTGEPEFEAHIREEWLEQAAGGDPSFLESIKLMGFRSYMCLPLQARGRTLGAITLVTADSGRRYTEDDLALAEDLARRASLAIDNARLYTEQQHVARTLQESLLPSVLPQIDGAEIRARYHAAGEAVRVGGDFYDVFEMGDGIGIVMGDVCGKGPEAAALTALARYTVRATTLNEQTPDRVLHVLNDAIRSQTDDDRFCTVVMARYQPATRTLTLSSGGHPPPLVLRANGIVEPAAVAGTLIGPFEEIELSNTDIVLEPGDAIVFYTDGVTEARTDDGQILGEAGLRGLLEELAGHDASWIAASIERAAIDFQDGAPKDDIAVLVLKVAS
jgi:PAS domain S-box-containing protein